MDLNLSKGILEMEATWDEQAQGIYKRWLDHLFDGVYVVNLQQRIVYWNTAAEELTGFPAEQVCGKRCSDNILEHVDFSGKALCKAGCPLHATLQDGERREALVFLHHRDGHRLPVHIRVSPIRDEEGRIMGAIEVFSDHSQHLTLARELEYFKQESMLDPLLRIGNRRYAEMIFQVRQYEYGISRIPFGVLMMDLDSFKRVNDELGHNVGDQVLKMTAQTIVRVLRGTDALFRWGGDEFLAFLPGISLEGLVVVSERIRVMVENSFLTVEGKRVQTAISIGATLARPDDTLESLVERADALLYQSKRAGGNRCTIDEHLPDTGG